MNSCWQASLPLPNQEPPFEAQQGQRVGQIRMTQAAKFGSARSGQGHEMIFVLQQMQGAPVGASFNSR